MPYRTRYRLIIQTWAHPNLRWLGGTAHVAACASIGVAVFPENGETPERLLEAADTALYRMKASGKGHYCLYHPEMSARIAERVLLADSLRR
ncbi:MAG: diguanylate cyclase domain-containing protein, partial [Gammaproteobacteria bacterium]